MVREAVRFGPERSMFNTTFNLVRCNTSYSVCGNAAPIGAGSPQLLTIHTRTRIHVRTALPHTTAIHLHGVVFVLAHTAYCTQNGKRTAAATINRIRGVSVLVNQTNTLSTFNTRPSPSPLSIVMKLLVARKQRNTQGECGGSSGLVYFLASVSGPGRRELVSLGAMPCFSPVLE